MRPQLVTSILLNCMLQVALGRLPSLSPAFLVTSFSFSNGLFFMWWVVNPTHNHIAALMWASKQFSVREGLLLADYSPGLLAFDVEAVASLLH
jgi:hypothetical protein